MEEKEMRKNSVHQLTISDLLNALAVLIPMIMPKIVIGPVSYTLASHFLFFVAMFFLPTVVIALSLVTFFWFLMTFSLIIALRALSHIIFAVLGALYLQKHPGIVLNQKQFQWFNVVIGLIHSVCEVLVVALFSLVGTVSGTTYGGSAFVFYFVFLGIGGFIHSLIDYNIAFFVVRSLSKSFKIPVFLQAKVTS